MKPEVGSAADLLNVQLQRIETRLRKLYNSLSASVDIEAGTWLCYGKVNGSGQLYLRFANTPHADLPSAALRLRVLAAFNMQRLVNRLDDAELVLLDEVDRACVRLDELCLVLNQREGT